MACRLARIDGAGRRPGLLDRNRGKVGLQLGECLVLIAESIYRSVSTHEFLAPMTIDGGPDRVSDADLAAAARPLLDQINADRLASWVARFNDREPAGRTTLDVVHAARAATFGVVETLLVDMDLSMPGTVDEVDGSVHEATSADASTDGVMDETARRVLLAGGTVMSVRRHDTPHGAPLAAILRYAI